MEGIITEQSGSILRVQLNRPAKRNTMTSSMYAFLADVFNEAMPLRFPEMIRTRAKDTL